MNPIDPKYIPDLSNLNAATIQERYFKLHFPEFHAFLIDNYPTDLKWSERLYWFVYGLTEHPVCSVCGGQVRFKHFNVGYSQFCSHKCMYQSESVKEKRGSTCLKKYGVANPMQNKEIAARNRESYTPVPQIDIQEYLRQDPDLKKMVVPDTDIFKNKSQLGTLYVRKRWPIFLAYIEYLYPDANSTAERLYLWYHRDQPRHVCPVCGSFTKFDGFFTGYRKSCSSQCSNNNESIKLKKIKTCLERFGTTNPLISEQTKNKLKERYHQSFISRHPGTKFLDDNTLEVVCPHPDCTRCADRCFKIPKYLYDIRKSANIELCTVLSPVGHQISGTYLENIIRYVLDKHNIKYQSNVRGVIGQKELDIFIPDKKVAIECNGVHWHSDEYKSVSYHEDKWRECNKQNIQLLTFWEDQIRNKFDIVQSIILSKLGIYEQVIPGRKCTVSQIDNSICTEFCNLYHLQGTTTSGVRYGLFYEDELIAVMTFGMSRGRGEHAVELIRYCVKSGWRILGGASKLFKRFIKEYHPESVISFSSNDISIGDLYKQLGFESVNDSLSYWYISPELKRCHRSSFTKDNIVKMGWKPNKDGWTESEVMKEHGYIKIWDSGQTKWLWRP